MMKINFTDFGTGQSGGNRVFFNAINGLLERGHRVTITSLGKEGDESWYPLKVKPNYARRPFILSAAAYALSKVVGASMRIKDFELSQDVLLRSPFYPFPEVRALAKSIPECDINVAGFWPTAFSTFLSQKGAPYYYIQHYEPYFHPDIFRKKAAELTYHLPLHQMVASGWLQKRMEEKGNPTPPIVSPAIDHHAFYPRGKGEKRQKLRILCCARPEKWKGFYQALEAMEIVTQKRKDIEFVVFGARKFPYHTTMLHRFVEFPSDDELAQLYSSADVFLYPSWYEGFAAMILEAMACGTPVITATEYGAEDFAFHEQNCLVVPPRDARALAEATLRLLDDKGLREKFSLEGIKTASQFTWEKTVDKIEQVFKEA